MSSTPVLVVIGATAPPSALAQAAAGDSLRLVAIAEAALDAISRGDGIAFTDLMVDETTMFRWPPDVPATVSARVPGRAGSARRGR